VRGGASRELGDEVSGSLGLVQHDPGAAFRDQLDLSIGEDGG